MLFYLDNWLSADPTVPNAGSVQQRGALGATATSRRASQQAKGSSGAGASTRTTDASCWSCTRSASTAATRRRTSSRSRARFTGWTIRANPRARRRVPCSSRGCTTPGEDGARARRSRRAAASEDGEQVLDILARHPVDRALHRRASWRGVSSATSRRRRSSIARQAVPQTDGDLREVVGRSSRPGVLARGAYRAKVKTPFEFVVSALRATGMTARQTAAAAAALLQMGDAALHVPAADGLRRHGGRLGQRRRTGGAHELRAQLDRRRRSRRHRSAARSFSAATGRQTAAWSQ